MSGRVTLLRAGPGMSIQDLGRPGLTAEGLSPGGAADRLALFEAAALLGMPRPVAAIEMAGMGGELSVTEPTRFALTGAPMRATLNAAQLLWNTTHVMQPGQRLVIGGVTEGTYGYLTLAGGIATPPWQNSRSAHLAAGVGGFLQAGTTLPLAPGSSAERPQMTLQVAPRFSGGTLRLMPGPQTELFGTETLQRFLATPFHRDRQANRQGVRLAHDGAPFGCDLAAGLASDFIVAGDVQMTGEGTPYVLLSECQTVGGYPRIGTVLPDDLPRIAQAPYNAPLRFSTISTEEADRLFIDDATRLTQLRKSVRPLVRDPRDIPDLLSYQLISGVTSGDTSERA